jgi:threonine/homoserine/homoserine lactone efflux protein
MGNDSIPATIMCGCLVILGGIWAIILSRNPIRNRLRLSAKANKIVTFLFGAIIVIFGVLIVWSALKVIKVP